MLPALQTKMRLSLFMLMMWGFMAMTTAQSNCDPLSQYEKNGECCKLCGPGTRMQSSSDCLDPQCTECGDSEYQDKYTREPKCVRQPYCDQNKNFQVPIHDKKIKSTCLCKEGFHCSSAICITCVPHTTCEPGHGARYKGNHTHDTVCQKCTVGTFSDDNSWDGVCKKWTECIDEYHIQQRGSDVSDNICEGTWRTHVVAIVCSVIGVILVVAIICYIYYCKGKAGNPKGQMKVCFESCLGETREPTRETKVLITNPTQPTDHTEEESMIPELQSSQEEAGLRTPEENDDHLIQEVSADVVRTENGNFVTQENGKTSILSRQESQTQTFTD